MDGILVQQIPFELGMRHIKKKKSKDESGADWGEGPRSWSGASLRRVGVGKNRGVQGHRERKRKEIKIMGDFRNLGCSKE